MTALAVGSPPATAAIIECIADHVAAHQEGVKDAADRGEHVRLGNERRMDAHLDRAVAIGLDDGEELEAVAELAGVEDVLLLHRAQALGVELVRRYPEAVGGAARTAALWAVSWPSTSRLSSASAKPSRLASASASLNSEAALVHPGEDVIGRCR